MYELLTGQVPVQANLAWALGKSGNWQQAESAIDRAIQNFEKAARYPQAAAWVLKNLGIAREQVTEDTAMPFPYPKIINLPR